jgi:hypothetical protein
MRRSLILAFLLCLCTTLVVAQAPWPGQNGDPVGYAAYGSLGTTPCAIGSFTSGTAGSPNVYTNCLVTGGGTLSANYIKCVSCDWNNGTTKLILSGSNQDFIGNRFQSNVGADANIQITGTAITFSYSSFTPLASFATSPPGAAWPSAGAGTNSTTQTSGVNSIPFSQGYQYGLNITAGGPVTVDHCDLWGFANGIVFYNTTAQMTVTNSWIHDPRYANGVDHSDGIGYLNGTAAPTNVTVQGNTIALLGNTQSLAFQGATSGYTGMQINSNYLSGDGYTVQLCTGSHTCTGNFARNVFGTDIAPQFGLLYSSAIGSTMVWTGDTLNFLAGTTWTATSCTPTSGMNGQYVLPTAGGGASCGNSATDQGSNTHTGLLAPSSLSWLPGSLATRSITLTAGNSGNLSGISFAFATGTQFSQVNNCPSTLVNGASCQIVVTYSPTGVGPVTDVLQITDSDPSSPEIIPLLGIDAPSSTFVPSAPTCGIPGPPTYPCSTISAPAVQTPNLAPFQSSLPTMLVNTSNSAISPCTANCIQVSSLGSGQQFNTGWSTGIGVGNGGNITINGVTFGVLTWNSTSVATLMSAPGTQTNVPLVNYTACLGACLNSVRWDTSLNRYPINPIVRGSDGGAVSGRTLSSTASGGDNDEGWNCAGRTDTSAACKNATLYLLAAQQGGCDYVEGIEWIGGIPQVVAPFPKNASTGSFSPCGALTFSHQNPWVGYFMGTVTSGPRVQDPIIYSVTYSWDGIVGDSLTVGTPVVVADLGAIGILPNGEAYNNSWSGPLSEDINDQLFWIALSNVVGISGGADTIAVTNGSGAFTLTGSKSLATDGSAVNSYITINGVTNTYLVATVTGGGLTGTFTPVWAGTSGSYSFSQPGGQGTGLHEVAARGTWSGTPGASTFTVAGASVYNTFTGNVTAFGTASGGVIDSTCANAHIHDSFGFSGTGYVQISGASTGTNCGDTSIFWNANTVHVVPCTGTTTSSGPLCAGHNTFGRQYEVAINNPNYYSFLPSNANSVTPFPSFSAATGGCENHFSWRHANSTDTNPVILASANPNYSTSGISSTWTSPYYNEIDILPVTGATPKRGPHSFILGPNNTAGCGTTNVGPFDTYFTAQNAIGITSQDGSMFAFSSSMLGSLATDSAGATRADDFIVGLDSSSLPISPFFGFNMTNTASSNFPTVTYGMQRFWDSPPLQWPSINTAAGTFSFTNLDTALATAYSAGEREAFYTLSRTPSWITSDPSDTLCHDQLPAVGGGPGQCYPPTDLNSDGTGTNATWKAWITKIASHANGQDGNPTYLTNHAHIRYWEIWNEPDASAYWSGSFAQLARLTEDARCILLGSQGGRNVIHQSGNGSATACTATPIDPTAVIIMSSGHATSADVLTYAQNQLYCNNVSGIPSYELPCPNPTNAIANAVDVINFHMKPGNSTGNHCPAPSTPCTVETAMATYVASIDAFLQPNELIKPLWDGEMSYAIAGFTTPYTDPDMASSLFPRMYLTNWSLGIVGSAWYSWDNLKAQGTQVQVAYQQTANYLSGAALTSPCTPVGTVYSCQIYQNGHSYLILWDNSKSCSGGSCTTGNVTVSNQWLTYQDMTSVSTPITIVANTVPVGIKAVILKSNATAPLVITNPVTCGTPPCPLSAGAQGVAYSYLMAATGDVTPYTWTITVGSLPSGLSLSSSGCGSNVNCNIQGTPSSSGTSNFTIQVCGQVSCGSLAVSLIVTPAGTVSITNPTCGTPPCPLTPGLQNVTYSYVLVATGGTPPYTWTISSGSLPSGLSLSSTGCGSNVHCDIQGTPLTLSTTGFTIQVCDTIPTCATLPVYLTVTQVAPPAPATGLFATVSHNQGVDSPLAIPIPSGGYQ